jgi:hypothetical protein
VDRADAPDATHRLVRSHAGRNCTRRWQVWPGRPAKAPPGALPKLVTGASRLPVPADTSYRSRVPQVAGLVTGARAGDTARSCEWWPVS